MIKLKNIIHIFGASGSGTTTLSRAISETWGHTHFDSDDYFWLPTDPMYKTKRESSERQKLLSTDIAKANKCVITGSLCGWGDIFIPIFELVIFVDTPTEIRIERLKERERLQFGDRILPGGDMYENHNEFIEWAARYDTVGFEQRSRVVHIEWLKTVTCLVINVDGSKPLKNIIKLIGDCI